MLNQKSKQCFTVILLVGASSCSGSEGAALMDLGSPSWPPPVIAAVIPNVGPSTGNVAIGMSGENFAPDVQVLVAGVPATMVVSSPTSLRFTLPPNLGKTGPYPVEVRNPDGKSTVRSDVFSYYYGALKFVEQPQQHILSGNQWAAAVADFNGDGKLDVVTATDTGTTVAMQLGDGQGNLGAAKVLVSTGKPDAVVTGDFTSDGKPDLLVGDSANGKTSLLVGDGSGGFAAATVVVNTASRSMLAHDLDGDGKLDLVIAGASASVLMGTGTGTFKAAKTFSGYGSMYFVAVGDLNRDGRPDVVGVGYEAVSKTDIVSLLLGDGTGNFSLAPSKQSILSASYSITVGDLDGDGQQDVVVGHEGSLNVHWLLGDGQGGLGGPVGSGSGGGPCKALFIRDLDLDKKPDLITVNWFDSSISILRGDFPGNELNRTLPPIKFGKSPFGGVMADMNNDGMPDLVIPDYGTGVNKVGILLNKSY